LLKIIEYKTHEAWICTGSAIAILIVFSILFYWTRQLRVLVGVIGIWLDVVGKSTWEFDFRAYHEKHNPVSQTKLASVSFLILGFGIMGLILMMLHFSEEQFGLSPQLLTAVIAFSLYSLFICEFGFRKRGIDEDQVKRNWIQLICTACYNRGIAQDMQKNYQEAIMAYERVIELNPNYSGAWQKKALALQHLGHDKDADIAFNKAKELGFASLKSK
jgi:tetratricopeptide (TPR) repeat protein